MLIFTYACTSGVQCICLLAYCLVNPKNWSPWWKLGGTAVKKPQVWSPLGLYRHVIISFMTFWPCRTSSGTKLICVCKRRPKKSPWMFRVRRALSVPWIIWYKCACVGRPNRVHKPCGRPLWGERGKRPKRRYARGVSGGRLNQHRRGNCTVACVRE